MGALQATQVQMAMLPMIQARQRQPGSGIARTTTQNSDTQHACNDTSIAAFSSSGLVAGIAWLHQKQHKTQARMQHGTAACVSVTKHNRHGCYMA
jgi:hypothetical protein